MSSASEWPPFQKLFKKGREDDCSSVGLDGKNRMRFSPMGSNGSHLFEDAVQFLLRLCPQHGYPGVAEIGNPFEERACCQVAAHVQYAPSFIQQVDAVFHFLAEYVQPPFGTERREFSPVSK